MMIRVLALLLFSLSIVHPLYAQSENQRSFLQYLLDEVLIKDSQQAVSDLKAVKSSLEDYQSSGRVEDWLKAQSHFKIFVKSWKKVEAVYVAGALNEDYLDHPRYIDYYHQGNESIPALVRRAINSEQALQTALFKNSTKSINALEFLLFDPDQAQSRKRSRRLEAALLTTGHIATWLEEVAEFYQSENNLVEQGKQSVNLVVNRLIDSSYKLKNWRIGEAGGLVKKYQGKPSAARLEYVFSGSSLDAVVAILSTHRQIVKNDAGMDLMALGKERGVESEIQFLLDNIDQALKTAQEMPLPITDNIETESYQKLFRQLGKLHNAYYFMLIDALGLSSQIIDADGD